MKATPVETLDLGALRVVIESAKKVAAQYRGLTGKPLGITGEVGEFVAADLLGLELTEARNPGYDAIAPDGHRIQVKARCVLPSSKPGQRMGAIKTNYDWDTVMLVLMDIDFEPFVIYEAQRADIERELNKPGSKSRARGALGVNKFKSIATVAWKK